jgi:hypothetical protein
VSRSLSLSSTAEAWPLADAEAGNKRLTIAPIARATIVRIFGQDPMCDLSDESRGALFVFSELLSAAGLAAREFFGLGYQNRDNFRIIVQAFSGDHSGAAITTRRRDGSTLGYRSEDSYRIEKPEHVSCQDSNPLDLPLLQSLMDSRESEEWESIYEAVLGFNLANTDSSNVSEHIEAVLLIGAFERLFDCRRGKEDELAEGFTNAITPTESRQPRSVAVLADSVNRFKKSASIRDMWIRDFFRLRGDLAHGKVESRYRPAWSLRNHLLLGSFALPLVLKSKLQSIGAYALTDRDQETIDMFEAQASEDHFAPLSDRRRPSSYPWNRVREEIIGLRLGRGMAAEISKHFGIDTDEPG